MVMVTGGAFQGKRECLKQLYGLSDKDIVSSADCRIEDVFTAAAVADYHELVKRLIAENIDVSEFTERFCRENSKAAVTINEIGCGIIPLEKSERIYREEVGRAGCIIAAHSETVIRVFCGIPQIIKEKRRIEYDL